MSFNHVKLVANEQAIRGAWQGGLQRQQKKGKKILSECNQVKKEWHLGKETRRMASITKKRKKLLF